MTKKSLKELMEDAGTVSGAIAATNNGFESGGIGDVIRRQPKPTKKRKSLKDRMDEGIKNEDRHPNEKPYGPEFKPTMPKGTVRVDVSDVYDWYKLGMHVADLKGLGKHDFGEGPPSTILSFGSEDEEHEYIKDLEKIGLTTTDIDPVDPKQPKGMKRQKTDPTYNVEAASPAQQAAIAIAKKKKELKEAPIEIDRAEPTNPLIYGHNKANPAKLQYRMMRAAGQLRDLAERVNRAQDAESLQMWQSIVANFKELAMNVDQIGHALEELEQTRRKGGVNSRGIPDLS